MWVRATNLRVAAKHARGSRASRLRPARRRRLEEVVSRLGGPKKFISSTGQEFAFIDFDIVYKHNVEQIFSRTTTRRIVLPAHD